MSKRIFIVRTNYNGETYKTRETINDSDLNNPENFGINDVEILLKIKAAGNSKMTVKRFLKDYGYLEDDDFKKMSKHSIETSTKDILKELFEDGPAGFDYIEI